MAPRHREKADPIEAAARRWHSPKAAIQERSRETPEVHNNLARVEVPAVEDLPRATTPSAALDVLDDLEEASGIDDDGYFKLVPGNDGKSWYLSYRWKRGLYAGKYVMAVAHRGDLEHGIKILCYKIAGARKGHIKPTPDKY